MAQTRLRTLRRRINQRPTTIEYYVFAARDKWRRLGKELYGGEIYAYQQLTIDNEVRIHDRMTLLSASQVDMAKGVIIYLQINYIRIFYK